MHLLIHIQVVLGHCGHDHIFMRSVVSLIYSH